MRVQEYQNVASFVPKLAGKVVQWLDLQKDDVLLDIGLGVDGILNADFAKILAQGNGSMLGIDSSASLKVRLISPSCLESHHLHANSPRCHPARQQAGTSEGYVHKGLLQRRHALDPTP